ncbi:MAG: hypothetical protein CVV52_09120, partial [Spirochaetae bacterium HGW-Spirochaetae-8]
MKIVLVGAGSIQFGYGMLGDIFNSKMLKGSEITLLDINEQTLKRVLGSAQEFIARHALDPRAARCRLRVWVRHGDPVVHAAVFQHHAGVVLSWFVRGRQRA